MKKYLLVLVGGLIIGLTIVVIKSKYPAIEEVFANITAISKGEFFTRVNGNSMLPTLKNKQMWYGDSCTDDKCWNHKWERGELVTIDIENIDPNDWGELLIKRVIGLPGEVVTITFGKIYINGYELNEPYIKKGTLTLGHKICVRYALGNDQLFVLGDNRKNSKDSRIIGAIKTSQVAAYSEYSRYQSGSELPSLGSEKVVIDEGKCPLK